MDLTKKAEPAQRPASPVAAKEDESAAAGQTTPTVSKPKSSELPQPLAALATVKPATTKAATEETKASPLAMLAKTCQSIGTDSRLAKEANNNNITNGNTQPFLECASAKNANLKRPSESGKASGPAEKKERFDFQAKQLANGRRELGAGANPFRLPFDATPSSVSSYALAELHKLSSTMALNSPPKAPTFTMMPSASSKRMSNAFPRHRHPSGTPQPRSSNSNSPNSNSSSSLSVSPPPAGSLSAAAGSQMSPSVERLAVMRHLFERMAQSDDSTSSALSAMLLRGLFDAGGQTAPAAPISSSATSPLKRTSTGDLAASYCLYCGKHFAQSSDLLMHVYHHVTERPESPPIAVPTAPKEEAEALSTWMRLLSQLQQGSQSTNGLLEVFQRMQQAQQQHHQVQFLQKKLEEIGYNHNSAGSPMSDFVQSYFLPLMSNNYSQLWSLQNAS